MKLIKNILFILFIYSLLACVICIICGFLFFKAPNLLLINVTIYHIQQGLLLFLKILPAIFISGIVVGYSWAFGKEKSETKVRFSAVFAQYLKTVFIIGLFCTLICFISSEVIVPYILFSQSKAKDDSNNIQEFLDLAEKNLENEDYFSAEFYTQLILDLDKTNNDALALRSIIENEKNNKLQKEEEIIPQENKPIPAIDSTMTIPQLMDKAVACYYQKDYFDAHYYASLVLDISNSTDGNRELATEIATDAWNNLEDYHAFDDELSKTVFESKKTGYEAIIDGDYSKAYYTFKKLLDSYPLDQDIQNYYSRARDLLNARAFFIDETYDLQKFEQYKNVHFAIPRVDDGKDIVSIKGITITKQTGSMLQYLRGFSLISYDKNNQLLMTLSVPYAKLCSVPIGNISSSLSDYIQAFSSTKYLPYLFFHSVDRSDSTINIKPEIKYYNGYSLTFDSTYILPIPYEDFGMLCDASNGPETMPLISLFKFAENASIYGFSTEVYSQLLISRLTYPFLVMICFILAAIIGWGSRLFTNDAFKFRWLFMFPLTTLIAYIFLDILTYVINILFYVVLGVAANASLLICLVVMIIFLFLCALRFISLKSN